MVKTFFLLIIIPLNIHLKVFSQINFKVKIFYPIDFEKKTRPQNKEIHLKNSIQLNQYLNKTVLKLYKKGYISAGYDSIRTDSSIIKAFLSPGKKYKWAKLKPGNCSNDELYKAGINLKKINGKIVSVQQISSIPEKLTYWYENNGYPFVRVSFDSISFIDNLISASIKLEKNMFFKIDSIIINGNAKINHNYLYHYLRIKPGSFYNESIINQIDSKLKEIEFLETTNQTQLIFKKNSADIYTFIDHKRANSINGLLGFLPDPKKEGKLTITGETSLRLLNPFRTGEEINFEWKKLESTSQKLYSSLVFPYISKSNAGFEFLIDLYKKDTSYLTVKPFYSIRIYNGGGNFLRFFYSRESSSIISTKYTIDSSFADYKKNMYGFGYHHSDLDYKINPRKGFSTEINIAYGNKKNTIRELDSYNDTSIKSKSIVSKQAEINFWGELFIPISKITTLRIANKSAFLNTFSNSKDSLSNNQLYYDNELFKLGGFKTLRGFDEDAILASGFSVFSFEYRVLFEKNSCLYLFYDLAFYEKVTINQYINDYPMGFGLGINFETKAGIFMMSYALGKEFSNPVEFRSAKIHVGIISRF